MNASATAVGRGSVERRNLKELMTQIQKIIGRSFGVNATRRMLFFLTGDMLVAFLAVVAVYLLVPGVNSNQPNTLLPKATILALINIVLTIGVNFLLRNYSLAWVTFSLSDLRKLFVASVLVTASHFCLRLFLLGRNFFPANPVLIGLVLFFLLALFRGSKRLLLEPLFTSIEGKRTLIALSARCGYFLPNILRRLTNFNYYIVGIVTPDQKQVGNYEQGIEVVGTTDDIEAIIERYRIEVVMVMLESDPEISLGDFYARLHRIKKVEVKTMPSLVDILEDRSDLGALEKLSIHELTGRPPVTTDVTQMRRIFSGKKILITGAGGSIGSELCRQLSRFTPELLVLFERDDSNLFYIERELRLLYPRLRILPFLGDINNAQDLERAFAKSTPEVVFHAAAYKHVPILESHPEDAIQTNVVGTHLVAKTAIRYHTNCFVYISTDKAVNPTSVMGATKRLGEMLVTAMNELSDMRIVVVRFGNVLDSRGSVSTIFRDAILKRQPITVTHPEMKRYLMLTSEAVTLVLQAAVIGKGGEVLVLDMGKPVRIWDLAHRMVELAGLTPNVDIPIIVTGIRPGEKLFEELLTAEEGTVATENERIYRARISRNYSYPELLGKISELEAKLEFLHSEEIKRALKALIPTYRPDEVPVNHSLSLTSVFSPYQAAKAE
ncbi:MAG: polysaccharide biosynthesis protein [bacterium]